MASKGLIYSSRMYCENNYFRPFLFSVVTCPCLSLGSDHGSSLGDPAQRLPQVAGPADKRNLERRLVDVVFFVSWRQYWRRGIVSVLW